MATTYKFQCIKCQYSDEIYIGNTKMEFMKKLPQQSLGSCLDCGKLFSNTKRNCKFCGKPVSSFPLINTFKSINNWFFNKYKPSMEVRFYDECNIKKIPCPKCSYKHLIPYPITFSD